MFSLTGTQRWLLARLITIAVLFLSWVSAHTGAAELRWKFKSGDEYHYRMVQDTQIRMIAATKTAKTTIAQTIDMTWKVVAVDPSGVATVTQTIDRMRLKGETPDGLLEADSQGNKMSPALEPTMGPMFKALIGGQFKLKMTPSGRIQDVEVPAGAVEAVQNKAGVGEMISAESLKEMTTQSTIPLPEKTVEPGDSWTDEKKLAGVNVLMNYRYDGPMDHDGQQVEKITTKGDIKLNIPETSGFKTEIEKGDLDGEVIFDARAGKLVGSKVKQDMVISISGDDQSVRQEIQSLVELRLVPAGGAEKTAPASDDSSKEPASGSGA